MNWYTASAWSMPAIIRGYAAGLCMLAEEEFLYLVMERAEGSLEGRLREGPLPVTSCARWPRRGRGPGLLSHPALPPGALRCEAGQPAKRTGAVETGRLRHRPRAGAQGEMRSAAFGTL